MTDYIDPVTWFEALGACRCGKPSTGILRGSRNESFGPYCQRCAEKRIKKAEQARDKAKRELTTKLEKTL
jgi:hypothetical protein